MVPKISPIGIIAHLESTVSNKNRISYESEVRRLVTNPWFKKPRDIGEKVDGFRMVLKDEAGGRLKKNL